jgi:hypothetical protein
MTAKYVFDARTSRNSVQHLEAQHANFPGKVRRPPSLDNTGLVVTLWSETGIAEGVFDFTSLPGTVQLRQQFAAAFDCKIGPAGPWRAWDTCYCGYQSARLLLSGLAALEQPPATMAQITPAVWISWRMSLPPTSGTRHHLVALRSLLVQARELPPETLEIVDRRVDPAPASREIAYTYQEFLRIRSAAATVFNSALVRIRDNREHLRRWRAGEFREASNEWLLGEALDCVARTGDVPLHAQAWRRPSRRHLTALGGRAPQQTWGRLFLSRSEVFAAAVLLVATESRNKSVLHRMRIPEHDPAVAAWSTWMFSAATPARRNASTWWSGFWSAVETRALGGHYQRVSIDVDPADAHRNIGRLTACLTRSVRGSWVNGSRDPTLFRSGGLGGLGAGGSATDPGRDAGADRRRSAVRGRVRGAADGGDESVAAGVGCTVVKNLADLRAGAQGTDLASRSNRPPQVGIRLNVSHTRKVV